MTFDQSLPALLRIILAEFGPAALDTGIFLRDADSRLAFVYSAPISHDDVASLRGKVNEQLAEYVDPQIGAFLSASELGEADLLDRSRPVVVQVDDHDYTIRLVEHRIIGQDWSINPAPGWQAPNPARIVFWSLKGGVGRTTALAVAATDLAQRGKRVLVVDLDLEAPGLGSILLEHDVLPQFGSLDFFVEYNRGNVDEAFLENLVSPSSLADYSGILHVVPAIGAASRNAPENVIPKLGRAYLESIDADGNINTFSDHTSELLDRLQLRTTYDAIFIDARAGLNETTAAALLGIGADVLMFAENTPQSFDGYRFLLAHLRGLASTPEDDWRLRLKMIHAKADAGSTRLFNDRSFALFSEFLYEEESSDLDAFNFDIDDPDAPHVPWEIGDDGRYRNFDPLSKRDQISERVYRSTFGDLLDGLAERINSASEYPQ